MDRAGALATVAMIAAAIVPGPVVRAQVVGLGPLGAYAGGAPPGGSLPAADDAGPHGPKTALRVTLPRVEPPRPGGISERGPPVLRRQGGDDPVSPGRATALSAVVPGAGQHLLGQRRKWVYLALEVAGWVAYVDRRSAGGNLTHAYRDFAWTQARTQSDPRIDGDWEYYETLTQWERSGRYDADPDAAGVQPESDPATYNGSIWALATKLFLPGGPGTPPQDPSWERALAYYAERGYRTEFLWDWTGTGGAQAEYVDLISASDRRYRQATNVLGAIIANHVVSAADAFLSARGVPTPSEIRVVPRETGAGTRWHATVALGAGG